MEKNISLAGTFDTKSKEYLSVKEIIEHNRYRVITIDLGTGAGGNRFSHGLSSGKIKT